MDSGDGHLHCPIKSSDDRYFHRRTPSQCLTWCGQQVKSDQTGPCLSMILKRFGLLYYIAIDNMYICLHSRFIPKQKPDILINVLNVKALQVGYF